MPLCCYEIVSDRPVCYLILYVRSVDGVQALLALLNLGNGGNLELSEVWRRREGGNVEL